MVCCRSLLQRCPAQQPAELRPLSLHFRMPFGVVGLEVRRGRLKSLLRRYRRPPHRRHLCKGAVSALASPLQTVERYSNVERQNERPHERPRRTKPEQEDEAEAKCRGEPASAVRTNYTKICILSRLRRRMCGGAGGFRRAPQARRMRQNSPANFVSIGSRRASR